MMGRHKLLTVSWRQYTAPKERHLEADETDAEVRMSPGWRFVDEIKQVFEKIRAIENDLGAPELHGGDYEDFSKQEDKIKVRVQIVLSVHVAVQTQTTTAYCRILPTLNHHV